MKNKFKPIHFPRLGKPIYYYRVEEFVTTFEKDPGKHKPISDEKDFSGDDLLKCRKEAFDYYAEREKGLYRARKYFLPFAAPAYFKAGKHAAFSLTLAIREYYSEDTYVEYFLLGEAEKERVEAEEFEKGVYIRLGLSLTDK